MSDYKLTDSAIVIRLSDGANIPDDPANTDRQRYTQWLLAGGTPLQPAAPTPEPVPQQITMRQCRLQLLAIGLLDSVDAAIAAIPDAAQRHASQIEWEYAATVERSSAWVQTLAGALGLTAAQIDDLFREAAKL